VFGKEQAEQQGLSLAMQQNSAKVLGKDIPAALKEAQTDIKNGKKFTLFYGNVNKNPITQVYTLEYTVTEGKRSLASNQEIEVKSSKLVTNDNTSTEVKDITLSSGFEGKMMANDLPTHNENLNKNVQSVNKKLIDALKEEFKKIP